MPATALYLPFLSNSSLPPPANLKEALILVSQHLSLTWLSLFTLPVSNPEWTLLGAFLISDPHFKTKSLSLLKFMLSSFGFSLLLSNPFCHLKIRFFIHLFLYSNVLSFFFQTRRICWILPDRQLLQGQVNSRNKDRGKGCWVGIRLLGSEGKKRWNKIGKECRIRYSMQRNLNFHCKRWGSIGEFWEGWYTHICTLGRSLW